MKVQSVMARDDLREVTVDMKEPSNTGGRDDGDHPRRFVSFQFYSGLPPRSLAKMTLKHVARPVMIPRFVWPLKKTKAFNDKTWHSKMATTSLG